MDRGRRTLVVVGLLNLILLGAVACGDRGVEPGAAGLVERVVRLEAWRARQEQRNEDQRAVARSFEGYMQTARDHAASVDRTLGKQAEATALLNSLLEELLQKLK